MNSHDFCRTLLKAIRAELTSEQRKLLVGAWAYNLGNGQVEFHAKDDFYWNGRGCCLYHAKAQGIQAWLQSRYPEDDGYDEGMAQGGDAYTDAMYGDSPDY